jgi:hypothetical protein
MIKIHYYGLTNPTTLPVPQTYFSLSSNNCTMYPGESDHPAYVDPFWCDISAYNIA